LAGGASAIGCSADGGPRCPRQLQENAVMKHDWICKLWERRAGQTVSRAALGQAGARVQRAAIAAGTGCWVSIVAMAAIWPAYAKQVPVDEPGSPGQDYTQGKAAVCKEVSVTGHVFYNDLRQDGRFSERRDMDGKPGHANPWTSKPAAGDNINYLGLRDATVRLYSYNAFYQINNCAETNLAGKVTIDQNGKFTWNGNICNNCPGLPPGAPEDSVALIAQVSLEQCDVPNNRCFSVRDPQDEGEKNHYDDKWDGPIWSRWLRNAEKSDPRTVRKDGTIDLGNNYFQDDSGAPVAAKVGDLAAQAANVFATMVDVTRKVHLESKVAFDHTRYGEIKAFFPSVIGNEWGGAHSHQASRLCVGAQQLGASYEPKDFKAWLNGPRTEKWTGGYTVTGDNDYDARHPETWLRGDEASHEYGHLVHFWAWGGVGKWASFCYEDEACDERIDTPEYTLAAFKEGWAEFISHMTYQDEKDVADSCAKVESDAAAGCDSKGGAASLCKSGRRYIVDVKHTLCDLWDGDADSARWGAKVYRDDTSIDLATLRSGLVKLWNGASDDERKDIEKADSFGPHDTATVPLDLCRFVPLLKSSSVSLDSLKATLGVNGIDCGLE